MKLTVGFSTTNKIHSRFIRSILESTNVSHCYISFYDPFLDTELVAHADFVGIVIVRREEFLKSNIVSYEFEFENDKLFPSLRKHLKHLGKGFAWGDLFSWYWALVLKRWITRKAKNPLEDPIRMICVDFVLYILNDAGITDLQIGLWNPKTLCDWIKENKDQLHCIEKI